MVVGNCEHNPSLEKKTGAMTQALCFATSCTFLFNSICRVLLTYCTERDKLVLPGVDGLVIGSVAPHVSGAVDQPGGVQHHRVPQQRRDEVGHQQRLPPKVPRHEGGNEEAHEHHGPLVIPAAQTQGARVFTQ